MSSPVQVRPAARHDVAAVAAVWEEAWLDGHRGHVPQALLAARGHAYFTERAGVLVDRTWVAEDETGVLGVVIVEADEVQQLMVAGVARGRGVGALLLDTAERAIAAEHPAAWLAVVPGNVAARAFYERRGWRDAGAETYAARTLDGSSVAVPVRRYVTSLGDGRPDPPH